jgi:hypothetical protein
VDGGGVVRAVEGARAHPHHALDLQRLALLDLGLGQHGQGARRERSHGGSAGEDDGVGHHDQSAMPRITAW